MSDITVIGLGLMGSALARAIHAAGHALTVWNRSPAKMQAFADEGVPTAADAASAVAASPIVVICIDDYEATHAMLSSREVRPLLGGRTLVQLSTGTPRDALEASAWMKGQGVRYLDGAILAGPADIGTHSGHILLSGDEKAYHEASPLMACLGGNVRFLGVNPRAASVLDLAWLCEKFGRFLAVTHAARLCESEGVSVGEFANLFDKDSATHYHASVIDSGDFGNCTATLRVWRAALKHIQTQAEESGINGAFPSYVAGLFEKAVKAGYGDEHVMALVKVLR